MEKHHSNPQYFKKKLQRKFFNQLNIKKIKLTKIIFRKKKKEKVTKKIKKMIKKQKTKNTL